MQTNQSTSNQILVVEDDIAVAEMLTMVLDEEGYSAGHARNGQMALAALHYAPTLPQVLLVDLMMPIMDGFQFHDQIRRQHHLGHIPMIMLSASSDARLLDAVVERELRFLPKPIDFSAMFTMLKELNVLPLAC